MTATYSRILGAFNESFINEVEINGSSCSFEFVFDGTITTSGSASLSKIVTVTSSGLIQSSGSFSYRTKKNVFGSGTTVASGTGINYIKIPVYGSGIANLSGSASVHAQITVIGSGVLNWIVTADVDVLRKVQIMHTDRTLYVPEDIREVFVDYDENRTLELSTEYREVDVPTQATYY